jgi:hypothetical protein
MRMELTWEDEDLLSAKRAGEFGLGLGLTSDRIPCNNHRAVLLLLDNILGVDTIDTKRPNAARHHQWGRVSRESEHFAADGTGWKLNRCITIIRLSSIIESLTPSWVSLSSSAP